MVKKYALKYDISFDTNDGKGFTKEEIEKTGSGGADAIFLVSLIRGGQKAHDGALSMVFMSSDGQNNKQPIPGKEIFDIFTALACQILEHPDTYLWQKELTQELLDVIRDMVKRKKLNER